MLLIHKQEEMIVFFTILFTFLPLFQSSDALRPVSFKCSNAANYTANRIFAANLNLLLDSLILLGPQQHGCSCNFTGENSDKVFGLVQCRANIPAKLCRDCIERARAGINQTCPMQRSAILRYDYCLLRYSDRFSSVEFDNIAYYFNLRNLLMNLTNQATSSSWLPMFATGESMLDQNQTVYGMVQCTRHLSRSDCKRCLQFTVDQIPNCCHKESGRVPLSGCNLRYESYPFLESPPPPNRNTNLATPSIATDRRNSITKYILLAAMSVTIVLVMFISIVCVCFLMKKGGNENPRVGPETESSGSHSFDLDTILAATSNFSDENKLKEGSFGSIYKGNLLDGREIAVKRHSWNSGQCMEQWKNEATVTATLEHTNLVRLLGYCMEGEEKLLVYEYVSHRSLDHFLFDRTKRGQLSWDRRFTIIKGISQGILYLHYEFPYKIVHRDLKAKNILLDSEFEPKISGFGLARLFRENQSQGRSQIRRTNESATSEDATREKLSLKSDVFNFGVLVLEIVSGRRSNDLNRSEPEADLLSYTWKRWNGGKVLELMDPTSVESCSITEVLRCVHIALLCVQENPGDRPTMNEVVLMLSGESITRKPKAPPSFFSGTYSVRPDCPPLCINRA